MAAEEVQGEVLQVGTELEEAATAWGKDLALESGEEPEDEDTQPDPEVPEDGRRRGGRIKRTEISSTF